MFLRLLKEGFLFAVNSIFVNKLRTFLSLFGITIGIFSIISVFTMLDWMEKSIRDSISSLGDNTLYVSKWPWGLNTNLQWWDIIKWPAISKTDYQAILNKINKGQICLSCRITGRTDQVQKNLASDINVFAVCSDFENIRTFEIENGRYFSPEEIASGRNEAVLGAVLAESCSIRQILLVNRLQLQVKGQRLSVYSRKRGKVA